MKSARLLALTTASVAGQDVAHPLQIGGDVSAPKIIHQAELDIPAKLMKKLHNVHYEVSLIVDPNGVPRNVTMIASNLPRSWQDKALRTVETYRFRPAERLGTPVAVSMRLETNVDGF